ncbi:MAG: hypothetical protein HQ465_06150 [Rhodospirillales bacterium]|nr:hypothetical protein [Rhodospirillales bacterium]
MTAKFDSLAQSLGRLSEAGPARDLWARAAVQERFTVETLLTDWFAAKDTVSADDEGAATTAALDLRELAVPALDADGKDALRLAPNLRYQILQNVGVEAASQALQAIPVQQVTSAETLFRDLLAGEQANPDKDDRQRLYQLSTIADWAGAVGMPLDFDPQDLRQSMRRRDFIEGLGGPDLSRFVGRKRELGQLRQLWLGHHKSSIALIEAPGGMGKSLLISRFVSDLLELPPNQAPDAVFHLDFDRRELQTARPATIVAELVKQARQWVSSDRVQLLDDLGQQSSFSSGLESHGYSRGSESHSNISFLCERLVDIHRLEPQVAPRCGATIKERHSVNQGETAPGWADEGRA